MVLAQTLGTRPLRARTPANNILQSAIDFIRLPLILGAKTDPTTPIYRPIETVKESETRCGGSTNHTNSVDTAATAKRIPRIGEFGSSHRRFFGTLPAGPSRTMNAVQDPFHCACATSSIAAETSWALNVTNNQSLSPNTVRHTRGGDYSGHRALCNSIGLPDGDVSNINISNNAERGWRALDRVCAALPCSLTACTVLFPFPADLDRHGASLHERMRRASCGCCALELNNITAPTLQTSTNITGPRLCLETLI
jgi:hypothetical protein